MATRPMLKEVRSSGPIPPWWPGADYRSKHLVTYLKIAGLAPMGDILDTQANAYAFAPNALAGTWANSVAYHDFSSMARQLKFTSAYFRRLCENATGAITFHAKASPHPVSSFHLPFRTDPKWCDTYKVDHTTAVFIASIAKHGLGDTDLYPLYSKATQDWFDYAWSTMSMYCIADDLLKRLAFAINTTKMAQPAFAGYNRDFLNKMDHRGFILAALRPELTEHIFPPIVSVSNEELSSVVPRSAITKRLTSSQLTLLLRVFDGALLLRDIPDDNYEPYIKLG